MAQPYRLNVPDLYTFGANITVAHSECDRLVTERVAYRLTSRFLQPQQADPSTLVKQLEYRLNFLDALEKAFLRAGEEARSTQSDGHEESSNLVAWDQDFSDNILLEFTKLAKILDQSKAIAVNSSLGKFQKENAATNAWTDKIEEISNSACKLLFHQTGLLNSELARENFLHPLVVALLAYGMGGPINAANTAYARSWRRPSEPGHETFHIEDDCEDIFAGMRLMMVWETQQGSMVPLSGSHSVFMTGDATPKAVPSFGSSDESIMTCMYDAKHTALYYDCEDAEAVRDSVTLDFHVNQLSDQDLLLLYESPESDIAELTLSDLVTKFPIVKYDVHFHRLLFEPKSLEAITVMLSSFYIPDPVQISEPTQAKIQQQRFTMYNAENRTSKPEILKQSNTDIGISGLYKSPKAFLAKLTMKARCDAYLPLGINLFPQTPIAENIEAARKFFRDMPEDVVSARLASYASILTRHEYSDRDLLKTKDLRGWAIVIEKRCLFLISIGCVDADSIMHSVASFATSLGSALDGPKEAQMSADPRLDALDFEIFGTHCCYLFLCADWLTRYLEKPIEGPYMVLDLKSCETGLEQARAHAMRGAHLLLRNWVAWRLFAELMVRKGYPALRRGRSRTRVL